MTKIIQKNSYNQTGFLQKENSDFGVDENGELAPGFQYHDALWWDGSKAAELQQRLGIVIPDFLSEWNKMFMRIAHYIVNEIKPKNVLELGCGSGELCKYIRDLDSTILTVTVDANQETVNSPYVHDNHFIARTDKELLFETESGSKVIFDLIISLEHFEHISEYTLNVFMNNIKDHSAIGTKLIFTANADEYPVESHKHIHCNAKPKQYWIDIINKYGFREYNGNFQLNRSHNTSEIFSERYI